MTDIPNFDVSVVIPITGINRKRHILTNLSFLMKQSHKNFEIILVEQIDCAIAGQRSKDIYYAKTSAHKHISIVNKINHKFNQPWMSNVGAQISKGKKLLFYDADICVQPNYIKKVTEFNEPFFFSWNKVVHLTKEVSKLVHKHKRLINDNNAKTYTPLHDGHAGYAVCVDRNFFFNELGCYNENFFDWGGNDNDISCRAKFLMKRKLPILPAPIYHLWHTRGYAKPSPTNRLLVFTTRMFPNEVTQRLKQTKLGNPDNPTLVNMDDLINTYKRRSPKR
jgi:hypothetical protein